MILGRIGGDATKPRRQPGMLVSLRAVISSVTSAVGFRSLIAPSTAANLSAPPAARTRIGVARTTSMGTDITRWFSGWSTIRPSWSKTLHSNSPTAPYSRSTCRSALADQLEPGGGQLGPQRPDADDDRVQRLGEIVDRAQAAPLDQRRLGRRAVDEGRGGDEIAVGAEGAGEGGGELGRIVVGEMGHAADQRHDVEAAQRPLAQVLQRPVERPSPAEADLHVVAQERRDIFAEHRALGAAGGLHLLLQLLLVLVLRLVRTTTMESSSS